MKINYAITASIVNVPVRLAMGFGAGLFTRNVALMITKNSSTPVKVATWFGAVCTTWALGHAVDCWCNDAVKALVACEEYQNMTNEDE